MRAEATASQQLAAGIGTGVARPEQIASLDGLEILHRTMAGQLPVAACAQTMHFLAIAVEHGKAIFQGTPASDQLNPMGTINGGWISAIMDSALGCAVLSTLQPGWGYFTIGLNMKYLKVLTLGTKRVRVEAELVSTDDKDATARATLFGPDGKQYAEATAICRLMSLAGKPSSAQ